MDSVREHRRMSPLLSTELHRALARERVEEMSRRGSDERRASCFATRHGPRRSARAVMRSLLAIFVAR
jgi:hypothetical protein